MANPNPQHNPTDGLNVAAYVQLSGSNERSPNNLTNRSGGGLTVATEATYAGTSGPNGQGYGAVAGRTFQSGNTYHPEAQYALTLSLSSKTIAGVAYSNTQTLTAVVKDVANVTYTQLGSPTYHTLCPQSAPTRPSSNGSPDMVATCSAGGVITAVAVGQVILEVSFPTFDQVGGDLGKIYTHVVVTVIA